MAQFNIFTLADNSMNAIKQGCVLTAFLALVAALISAELVTEMEQSIAEAERFIQSMK